MSLNAKSCTPPKSESKKSVHRRRRRNSHHTRRKSMSIQQLPPVMEPADNNELDFLKTRFWLIAAAGGTTATFGIVANALLTKLFASRLGNFRHSPFFFLGFVALFDTLLDNVYILVSTLPIASQYFEIVWLYPFWFQNLRWFYLLGQIFKISSVFCLVVASFERYMITSHWTFSGFDQRTRWIVLAVVVFVAIAIRLIISIDIAIIERQWTEDIPYRHYAHHLSRKEWFRNFLDLLTVIVPFGTLVFLNVGIVLMVRQQNVQQLRSLLTELTMGPDFTKIRRRNIRAATNTMLLIISIYLISNLLGLCLSVAEYTSPGFLERNYPHQFLLGFDCASLLTVFGNALRFPAHYFSNAEVREQFWRMMSTSKKENEIAVTMETLQKLRRASSPWYANLMATARSTEETTCTNEGTGSTFSKNNGGLPSSGRLYISARDAKAFSRRQGMEDNDGYCSSCGCSIWECCCGGLLVTEREPFFEDYFDNKNRTKTYLA